jgi:WD40 repeat protein
MLTAPATVEFLSWSADSRRIVVGSVLDKRVGVYDVASGTKVTGPTDRLGGVKALAHSADGRYLAIAHGRMEEDGQSYAVSLWDPTSGAHIQSLVESWEDIKVFNARTLAFSPDNRYLAVAYQVATFIYDVQTPGRARAVGRTTTGAPMAFFPSSRHLALSTVKGLVVSECPTGRIVTTVGQGPRWLGFSPDGRFLITSSLHETHIHPVLADDMVGDRRIVPFGQTFNVDSISVSSDSRLLALAGGRRVTILTLADLRLAATLTDQRQVLMGALFSPDGASIATFGGPDAPTIWAVPPVR